MLDYLLLIFFLIYSIAFVVFVAYEVIGLRLFKRKVEALEHIEDILDYQHKDNLDRS